jgi:FAD/FMN-containing dehydrogenase
VGSLGEDLTAAVEGEVRFDAGARALYSTDASNYRQLPLGVVLPRSVDDVIAAVEVCRGHDVAVLPRGGGTSLAGQACNEAVVIDTSRHLRRVLAVDPDRRTAVVEPGVVLDDLRDAAERHHLTFGPDPATHNRCTLGGMIGNDSCGVHSLMAGRTADNVAELDVLTYDGERLRVGTTDEATTRRIVERGGRPASIYASLADIADRYGDAVRSRFPRIPRRVSGYGLDQLLPENGFNVARALVGTEGTCAMLLGATVELVPSPPARALVVLGFSDVYAACDRIRDVLEHEPVGLEGFDGHLVADMREKGLQPHEVALLPEGTGWLLVEFGGDDRREAEAKARRLIHKLGNGKGAPSAKLFDDPAGEAKIWEVREAALGATARVPNRPDAWPGWEDSAVPPEAFADYLRQLRSLVDRYRYHAAFYGHFGQGCLHTRISFDLETAAGIARMRSFVEEAADLVVGLGGSLSGEHGDGQARAELLPKMFGDDLVRAFEAFKATWDPRGRMNPGKVVRPRPLDADLRLGTGYRPIPVTTHFRFPDDDGTFARAALRCVGVGKCRRTSGGTMCPSYMATLEEEHSTRGRARLLFEMLNGDELSDRWRDQHVRDALDLCLACKGCKGDCPVNVDMATYKAEFLSHYYRRRLRPRSAYAMGLIGMWARAAARAPRLANVVMHAPRVAGVVKRLGGIAPEREVPKLAEEPFTRWYRATRGSAPTANGAVPVMLWPDTFNTYFKPATARAAAPGQAVLLWPPSVRLRLPQPGEAAAAADPRRPADRDPGGHAGGRARAELRGRVPRRARQPVPRRPRRAAPPRPDATAERAVAGARPRRRPRAPSVARPHDRPGPLPSPCRDGIRRGGNGAGTRRPASRGAGLRLLRDGGGVRVRAGRALPGVDGGGRTRAAPRRACRRFGRADRRRRLQLPRTDRAVHGPARAPPRRGAARRAGAPGLTLVALRL